MSEGTSEAFEQAVKAMRAFAEAVANAPAGEGFTVAALLACPEGGQASVFRERFTIARPLTAGSAGRLHGLGLAVGRLRDEEQDRRQWVEDFRRRMRLVTTGTGLHCDGCGEEWIDGDGCGCTCTWAGDPAYETWRVIGGQP